MQRLQTQTCVLESLGDGVAEEEPVTSVLCLIVGHESVEASDEWLATEQNREPPSGKRAQNALTDFSKHMIIINF